MAGPATRRRPRVSLRQAFHARRHPSLLLSRFRRDGGPAARSRQCQHRRLVRPRRATAVGEGVSASIVVPAKAGTHIHERLYEAKAWAPDRTTTRIWVPDQRSRSLSSGARSRDPLARLSGTTPIRLTQISNSLSAIALATLRAPEICLNLSPFEDRGRGECRVPNAPAAWCALR